MARAADGSRQRIGSAIGVALGRGGLRKRWGAHGNGFSVQKHPDSSATWQSISIAGRDLEIRGNSFSSTIRSSPAWRSPCHRDRPASRRAMRRGPPGTACASGSSAADFYRRIGLSPNESSLHFQQDDGFVHALDLGMIRRPEWRHLPSSWPSGPWGSTRCGTWARPTICMCR